MNIVDFLLVLVNDLVSIEDHVPAKQPGYPGGKQNAEQTVKGLKLFRDKNVYKQSTSPYFDEHDNSGDNTKPLVEGLVWLETSEVPILRVGEGEVRGGEGDVPVVEGVEADQQESQAVQSEAQPVVEGVLTSQQRPGLQLGQNQLHPPPPLHILEQEDGRHVMLDSSYLGHGLTVPQLPDGAKVVEELPAAGVTVEDVGGEEREEEDGGCEEEEVEAGVRV